MLHECHITTTVEHAPKIEVLAAARGWKTSEIKRDPILGDQSYFYLTKHDTDYYTLANEMRAMSRAVIERGAPVLRQKIEGIIFDTKKSGVLAL